MRIKTLELPEYAHMRIHCGGHLTFSLLVLPEGHMIFTIPGILFWGYIALKCS